jgi:DASS family divalent anion:Na+ symporter
MRPDDSRLHHATLVRWTLVVLSGLAVFFLPAPAGITPAAWRLLAIFVATVLGLILRPMPGGAVVLLGITAIALTGTLPIESALAGYADPIVWLVLAAFLISRGMIKTGSDAGSRSSSSASWAAARSASPTRWSRPTP